VKKNRELFIFFAGFIGLASIFILPNFGMDPFSLPKMMLLTLVAFCFTPYALQRYLKERRAHNSLFNLTSLLIAFMFLGAIASFLVSDIARTQQFYGMWGRNTGLLTFLCLILILSQGFLFAHKGNVATLLKSLFIFSTLSAIYGVIQFLGLEPINYKNGYSPLIGFFGNPNFQSTFLGLGAISSVWFAISQVNSIYKRILLFAIPTVEIFLIYKSGSIQGIFVFVISIGTVISLYGVEKAKNQLKKSAVGLIVIVSGVGVLGLLGIGPIARYFDAASIEFRRVYWQIGIRMIQDNMLFGQGLDGYGDYFRRFRTREDEELLSGTVTNAAHNVFIDFGVSAGLPFLLAYLTLVVLAVFLLLRNQLGHKTSLEFKVLSGLFVAFQCEMLIGINQIGLAIWGFVILGTVLGVLIRSNQFDVVTKVGLRAPLKNRSRMTVSVIALGVAASAISVPPVLADHNFRSALFAADGKRVFSAGIAKPLDMNRLISTGDLMRGNGLIPESREIAKAAIQFNPDSLYTWLFLLSISDISAEEREEAVQNAKRLDPLWIPK